MPDAIGERPVGTDRQNVLQLLNRGFAIPAARVNVRQKQLRLVELRGVQAFGRQQILLGLIELSSLK